MKTTYYEAFGETRKKIKAALDKRVAAFKGLKAWAKKQGGKLGYADSTWGSTFTVACDSPKEPEHWKLCRKDQPGFWEPKHSTKRGKELRSELEELSKGIATKREIADAIKLDSLQDGLYLSDLGTKTKAGRVLVAVRSDSYKPPKGVNLRRISDITYEGFKE